MRRLAFVSALALLAVGGCGGSSHHAEKQKTVTAPAYGAFHATTEAVTSGTPALCRRDANAFARNAVSFLVPSASPPDLYFVAARTQFVDFQAHSCTPSYLRAALASRLTPRQRRVIARQFAFLGTTADELG